MVHPNPSKLVVTDDSTTCGVVNRTSNQQISKAIAVWFYLVKECIKQVHFHEFFKPVEDSITDYLMKQHMDLHHIVINPIYIQPSIMKDIRIQRGRVNSSCKNPRERWPIN